MCTRPSRARLGPHPAPRPHSPGRAPGSPLPPRQLALRAGAPSGQGESIRPAGGRSRLGSDWRVARRARTAIRPRSRPRLALRTRHAATFPPRGRRQGAGFPSAGRRHRQARLTALARSRSNARATRRPPCRARHERRRKAPPRRAGRSRRCARWPLRRPRALRAHGRVTLHPRASARRRSP